MSRRFPDMHRPSPQPMGTIGWMLVVIASVLAAMVLSMGIGIALSSRAHSHWEAGYADALPAVRDWYETRELTAAAQKRFPFKSCCAHSDVVQTKFKVGGAGNDEWWWLDADGKWQRVPADVIHWNEHAPGGHPVMFAVENKPVCFFPPDGGI